MPRYREGLTSFLRGEVSPKMYGRTEIADYKQSCEKIRNMLVYPQGGAGLRPGTQYKFTVADSITDDHPTPITKSFPAGTFTGGNVRIFPFIISETEAYLVMIGVGQGTANDDGYPCIIYDAYDTSRVWIARMQDGISYLNATYSIPRWFPSNVSAHEIQGVPRGNVLFLSHQSTIPWALEYTGDFTQAVGGSTGGPFILRSLSTFYALGKYPDTGTTSTEVVGRSWPYQAVNTDPLKTVDLSADGAEGDVITITCSDPGIITQAMIGCPFKITNSLGTATGIYLITDYDTGTDIADAIILRVGAGIAATSNWSRPQWFSSNPGSSGPTYSSSQDTTARYWPRSVGFYENRLIYGGNKAYPGTLWGSAQGNVADFKIQKYLNDSSTTITNDMAFEFEIAATEFSSIRWISSAKTLQVGTLGREYIVFGPDTSQSLGPLNVSFNGETNHGSTLVQPIRTENALLFVQRSGRKIREFTFNFAEDSYRSADVSILSEHIFDVTESLGIQSTATYPKLGDGTVIQTAHQESPHGISWFLDDYGGLIGMTRNRQLEVLAFHHHLLAGAGPTGLGKTGNVEVRAICVIPSSGAIHDDLWMVVRRVINGSTVTYVEMMGQEYSRIEIPDPDTVGSNINNYFVYMDCASLKYNATPFTSLSFSHLAGATVGVVADGKYLGTITLDGSGNYTLDNSYNSVVVGFMYEGVLKTLNLEAGSAIGTSQGAMKRVDEVNLRFYRTIGAKFGPSEDDLEEIDFRPAGLQDDPIPLFSGDKTLKFRGGNYRKAYITLVQDIPLPMQITSIVARLVEND